MGWRACFDGGSRGNPGTAGAGAVLYDPSGAVAWRGSEPLGQGTNNEAEYRAAAMVIREASRRGIREIELCGDSKLVIQQLSGKWKIKEPRLKVLADEFMGLSSGMSVTYRWIPREENSEADRLANLAMDGVEVGEERAPVALFPRFVPEILVLSSDEERFSVDLRRQRCSCDDFARGGGCEHLDFCRKLGLIP